MWFVAQRPPVRWIGMGAWRVTAQVEWRVAYWADRPQLSLGGNWQHDFIRMQVILTTTAPLTAVLEAIRQDLRVWQESAIPPSLRSRGVVQVEGSFRNESFELRYAGSDEAVPDVVLRGQVVARSDGGCEVVATLARGAGEFLLPAFLGVFGLWELFQDGGIHMLVLAGLAAVAAVAYTETLSRRAARDGAYLIDRLRGAVGRATRVEPIAPAR